MNPDDVTGQLLRDRMDGAAAHLVARPDAAERAAQGGRRRIQRRRTTVAGVVAVVALIAVLPFTPLRDLVRPEPVQPARGDRYGELLDRPTQGDLASDARYIPAVLALWQKEAPNLPDGVGRDLRGEPNVAWAGLTPAGPAAMVVQLAHVKETDGPSAARTGMRTVIGFIGNDDARPFLVSSDHWRPGTLEPQVGAWFVDRKQSVMVVRDTGARLGWSYGPTPADAQELVFEDGAAVVNVLAGLDPADVRLTRWPNGGDPDLAVAEPTVTADTPLLSWPEVRLGHGVSGVENAKQKFTTALAGRVPDTWVNEVVSTGRDAGTDVIIGVASKNGRGRSYAVLQPTGGTTSVVTGPAITDPDDTTISFELPGHGWAVVRDQAGFDWRVGNGRWHGGPEFAGFLPEEATAVRVTPYNGTGQRHVISLK